MLTLEDSFQFVSKYFSQIDIENNTKIQLCLLLTVKLGCFPRLEARNSADWRLRAAGREGKSCSTCCYAWENLPLSPSDYLTHSKNVKNSVKDTFSGFKVISAPVVLDLNVMTAAAVNPALTLLTPHRYWTCFILFFIAVNTKTHI